MNLQEKLAEYMELLQCSAKDLSEVSGLPPATLSRYRSGQRQLSVSGEQFEKLAAGLAALAAQKGLPDLTPDSIRADLRTVLAAPDSETQFSVKLDQLIRTLHINVSRLARTMNYDASFLSKIRSSQRYPSDLDDFANRLTSFVAYNYSDETSCKILSELIGCQASDISNSEMLRQYLGNWLVSGNLYLENALEETSDFLHKLDVFNLEDYIRAIHFDELKVPTTPFQLPSSKTFHGIEGQKKAELDFLKGTVLSKSKDPVFLCSDMDMSDMSEDKDFSKKWMVGLAMILKKGQPITIVHNLNRPFHELMLGLEAYIPLYMTGLVSPHYFKGVHNTVFRHFLNVSGSYALSGEAVADFHNNARFLLTNSKEDVAYYRERADLLLKKSYSLMDIYTSENRAQYEKFQKKAYTEPGVRHLISSSLPVFTLSPEKLEEILVKANIPETRREELLIYAEKYRSTMEKLLAENIVRDELPLISREEYETHPLTLSFAGAFCLPVCYSYSDYEAHLKATAEYASAHPSYRIQLCSNFAFRNINIRILEGKWVWISKAATPTTHFVIYQQQLREAIEKMYVPITD